MKEFEPAIPNSDQPAGPYFPFPPPHGFPSKGKMRLRKESNANLLLLAVPHLLSAFL